MATASFNAALSFAVIFHDWTFKNSWSGLPVSNYDLERARREVRGPGLGLVWIGVLNSLSLPIALGLWLLTSFLDMAWRPPGWSFAAVGGIGSIQGLMILHGGLRMRDLELRPAAVFGSVMALCPVGLGLLGGMAVGVWSLVVLSKSYVVAAFLKLDGSSASDSKPVGITDSSIAR